MILSSHQPNFVPYMGFFYKMFQADTFVLSDDHQFSKSGMHNWNYLRIGERKHKITVPVSYEFGDRIKDVRISYAQDWVTELLKTMQFNYKKAPHYEEAFSFLEKVLSERPERLVELNGNIIIQLAERFGMKCNILYAHDIELEHRKEERIIELCKKLGADVYYSGIGGKNYNDPANYEREGISLVYTDYEPVQYTQIGNGFIENLSVLDWIFNMGFELPKEWR